MGTRATGQDPVKEGGVEHQDKPHWTKAPPQDERLYRYFTGNDLQPGSMHGAFQHMSETSFARGAPDPDARMVNSGAVGFVQRDELELIERGNVDGRKRERVSRAQEHRETRAMLAQIDGRHVEVLRLAYGPTDAIPALKLGANPQARAKLDGDETERDRSGARKAYAKRERLGAWRQVLPSTGVARAAHQAWLRHAQDTADARPCGEARTVLVTLEAWLVNHATEKELSAARVEANNMVREAWNLWADVRGRRAKRLPRTFVFERGDL